jgi:AraC family transcriptional regulator of adaptative response / DNA-3-methyladenine glycosylase II
LIHDGFLDDASIEALADAAGVGARHLHRLFLQHVGASPIAVAQTRRLHFAKRLVDGTDMKMTEIAFAAGFGSVRRFNHAFLTTYRRAPRELRRRGVAAQARDEVVLTLAFRPPYDWPQVRDFLATRAVPGVERVDARGYARTVSAGDAHASVHVRPLGRGHALELRVRGAPPRALFALSSAARRVFDVAADPSCIAAAFRRDSLLASLVRRRPGLRIPGVWDPFECAVRAVLGQQVSVAAARTLAARLVARLGRPIPGGADGLTHLFPTANALAEADLGGLGLTTARVAALHALARAVSRGTLDFAAPAAEVTAGLAALPGFGRWTAEYVALRALGEPDAFPHGDLVLRRMAAGDGTPLTAAGLAARAGAWRPWRAYAALHLWRAAGDRRAQGGNGRARVGAGRTLEFVSRTSPRRPAAAAGPRPGAARRRPPPPPPR